MNCTITLTNPDGSKLFETSCSVSRVLTEQQFNDLVRQVFVALSYDTPTEGVTTTENITKRAEDASPKVHEEVVVTTPKKHSNNKGKSNHDAG